MFDTPPDLDQYRSVEELQRLALDAQGEMIKMEREADESQYSDAQRSKFAGLGQPKKDISHRVGELRARERMILENAAAHPGRVERPEGQYYGARSREAALRLDEPRHVTEGRESGLRAIEQQASILTARAGDRLEGAVRSDQTGVGGQYLVAVANPHYSAAFGKMIADRTADICASPPPRWKRSASPRKPRRSAT